MCEYFRGSTVEHIIFINDHLIKPLTFGKFPKINVGVLFNNVPKIVGDTGYKTEERITCPDFFL